MAIASSGRARWVIENGNNNVLKTKGYLIQLVDAARGIPEP